MITVNMLHDENRAKDLSALYELENYEYMLTLDGDTEKAVMAVKAEGENLYIKLITALEDDMAEMAIRAALAYGDNRGAVTAFTVDQSFDMHFQRVGFTEKDGVYTIEISKVVHYCG